MSSTFDSSVNLDMSMPVSVGLVSVSTCQSNNYLSVSCDTVFTNMFVLFLKDRSGAFDPMHSECVLPSESFIAQPSGPISSDLPSSIITSIITLDNFVFSNGGLSFGEGTYNNLFNRPLFFLDRNYACYLSSSLVPVFYSDFLILQEALLSSMARPARTRSTC